MVVILRVEEKAFFELLQLKTVYVNKFININMYHPVYTRLTCLWSMFGCCLRFSFLDAISCSPLPLSSASPWFQSQFSFYGTHVTSLFPQWFFCLKENFLSKIHLKMSSYRCLQCSYVHWLALTACIFSRTENSSTQVI